MDDVSTDEWVVWTGVLEVSKNFEIACIEFDVSDNISEKMVKSAIQIVTTTASAP